MSEKKEAESISKHDDGKYIGYGEEEMGRVRTGNPDLMGEKPHPERTAEITEGARPHFTTSMDQRDLNTDRDEEAKGSTTNSTKSETEGMALKEDAEPGADAQGG